MLAFGHAGITLGVTVLSLGVLDKLGKLPQKRPGTDLPVGPPEAEPAGNGFSGSSRPSWLTAVASFIDLRILLVGSLLPDFIDKPVGIYLFPEVFSSGRIFSHSLLFAVLVTLAGIFLFRRTGKTWLMALSIGVCMHLILDQMWLAPHTLFWPAFGTHFDTAYLENWLKTIFYELFTDPSVFIPELIGAAISVWFVIVLLYNKKVFTFLRYGHF